MVGGAGTEANAKRPFQCLFMRFLALLETGLGVNFEQTPRGCLDVLICVCGLISSGKIWRACVIKTCSDVKNHASSNHSNELSTMFEAPEHRSNTKYFVGAKLVKSK